MKMLSIVLAVLFAGALSIEAQANQSAAPGTGSATYYVVKCTDYDTTVSYKVCTQQELKALNSEIAAETRVWDKAFARASKEWTADPAVAETSFPRGAIKQRRVASVASFESIDKANAQLDKQVKKLEELKEAEKKREEAKEDAVQNGGGCKGKGKQKSSGKGGVIGSGKGNRCRVIVNPRAIENRKQAVAEFNAKNDKAVALFKEKLSEVIAGTPGVADGAPAL